MNIKKHIQEQRRVYGSMNIKKHIQEQRGVYGSMLYKETYPRGKKSVWFK